MVFICADGVVGQMSALLKASVQECEDCVFVASGQADAPEEPESADTGPCQTWLYHYILTVTYIYMPALPSVAGIPNDYTCNGMLQIWASMHNRACRTWAV